MRVVLRTVDADLDFVEVDRRDPDALIVTMREGMSTRSAFVAARMMLTDDELRASRASFDGPPLSGDPSDLDGLLPFISHTWVTPVPAEL